MNLFSEPLQQVDRVFVRWRRRKLIYFAGCDYYRLGSHPQILKAVADGLGKFGLNVAASRATTGNHVLYEQLEREAARFFGASGAILTSNGYFSNIVAAQSLRGKISTVIIDERAHASLQDAAQILQGRIVRLQHRNVTHLNKILGRFPRSNVALLTDGIFAHDGSIPPLDQYRAALGPEPLLWIDDAHAAGVLGKNGQGSPEHFSLSRENMIQTITFSKAFGTYGGAILCDRARAQEIAKSSPALTGNTPLPLPLAHAALIALRILRVDKAARGRLRKNISAFRELAGLPGPESQASAAPIFAVTSSHPARLKASLLENGIYPPFIHYPGGPVNGYFRFALSSEHTIRQITTLAAVLKSETP